LHYNDRVADKLLNTSNSSYSESVEETYQFLDDESSSQTQLTVNHTPISLMGKEIQQHDVVSFLARPMRIAKFTVAKTDVLGQNVASVPLISLINNKNASNKLTGFRYLRGDIEISVYVNAQPFQAGAILLYYSL
jgi:hypothetical protein